MQTVKEGDVVQIHDDCPRIQWRLGVVEQLNKVADGLIRSVQLRTSAGKTNCPIAKLCPLEVTAEKTTTTTSQTTDGDVPTSSTRPVRTAAKKGQEQMKQWTALLRGPPEDVTDSD